ncbi:tripartite tricarboxylate transporter substrate binding protein [Xanthobacteraceae bacterium Astr-EGSB]|uniref:tripartite tricarboxylate transporter substrate binding protein n=1 Tax=Astrobacterium formosum TaxID=3069710 RepID=UPI0027B2F210|nr:tripartite tricarboxylate transporter substrate binding protein [Xanthobacteraceae bacterium Astr-EGSB]
MRYASCWKLPTLAAASFVLAAATAGAADFPASGKAIQMVVGFAAGGSSDAGARILAGGMEKVLGTKVEVLNKPGASGQIGYTAIAKSKPDGYTIGLASLPGIMVSCMDADRKAVYTKDSFQPVALQVVDAGVIAVPANSPYKTLKDFVDDAKARPKKVTVSTTGLQTGDHFSVLQLQKLADIQVAIVHFDGASTAMTALLGKKIDVYSGNVGDILSQLKSGDIRVLGVMDNEENPFLPGVKTFKAQGYPLLGGSWRGYLVPAGTPAPVVKTLSDAIKGALENNEVKANLDKIGLQVRYMDVAGYSSIWNEYAALVKDLIPLSKQ